LSKTFRLDEVGEAAFQVHHNLHEGKLGVLCLSPERGMGIEDGEKRAEIGEDKITLFQRHAASLAG
jgi:crotonyl-CoA reductase